MVPIHYPTNGGCSCGKPACPAAGKHPRVADWAKVATDDQETIKKWYSRWPTSNVGVAMGVGSGIIDIETDVKHRGDQHLVELEMLLGDLPLTLSFKSGSGGTHRLFSTNGLPDGSKVLTVGQLGVELLGMAKGSRTGVDVRGEGGQAVFPPSMHLSGKRYEWLNYGAKLAEIPEAWVPLLLGQRRRTSDTHVALDDSEAFLLHGSVVLPDVTESLARSMLRALSPETTRLEWVTVGEALKAQFGEAGLPIFIEWSAGELAGVSPSNYAGVEDVEMNWGTFGNEADRSKQVTFKSVIMLAKKAGWSATINAVPTDERKALRDADEAVRARFDEALIECSTLEELHKWVAAVKQVELFDSSKDSLRELVRDKWEEITHKTLAKTDADKLMDDGLEREEEARERAKDKGWANPYVFCAEGQSHFYNLSTQSEYLTKGFDQMYSSELISAVSRAQGKLHPFIMPSALLLNGDMIEKVYGPRYAPGQPQIFERGGERFVNTYLEGPVGVPRGAWTAEDAEAVTLWEKHLAWLLNVDACKLLRQFFAFVARNTGVRVRWCPLIYGPEGIGKSILGGMMATVLGGSNCGSIGPEVLSETKYNDWAVGKQLSVIEEIKADGASKWEVMRSLKAAVTNDRISVHPKGGKKYETENVTSYVAFTNSANALALDANDRRYYVTTTNFDNKRFIQALGGAVKANQYFTHLMRALEGRGGVFRGWLDEVDLSDFDHNRAPDSAEKAAMVQESRSDIEVAIEAVCNSGEYKTVRPELIELETLKEALLVKLSRDTSGQQIARQLRDLGYAPLSGGSPLTPVISGRETVMKSRWYVMRSMIEFDPHLSPSRTIKHVLDWYEFL